MDRPAGKASLEVGRTYDLTVAYGTEIHSIEGATVMLCDEPDALWVLQSPGHFHHVAFAAVRTAREVALHG